MTLRLEWMETPDRFKRSGARLRLLAAVALAWSLMAAGGAGALAATALQTAEASDGAGDSGSDAAAPAEPRHNRIFGRGLKFKQPETYRGFERTSPTRGLMLPPAADLANLFPPPKDQGDQSSCVGWSVSYAMRGYYANRAQGRTIDHSPILLSPAFVYNQIADPSEGCDGGSEIADALTLLRDVGTVPMTRFPYRDTDCKRRPPADVKREAGAWRIQSWRTVDLSGPTAIKEQIAKGDPVVIGMYVNDAFTELTGSAVFRDTGHDGGGHAMVVVGYDDRKRAFRLANSWGPEWGENGFGWISYDSLKARTDEAYVATVANLPPLANTSAPTRPPEPVAPPDPSDEPQPDSKHPHRPAPGVDTPAPGGSATPPELKAKGRQAFADYQAARTHKAFAVAPDGSYGWRSGRADASTAGEEATAACESHTSVGCRLADVDGRAAGDPPAPPEVSDDDRKPDPSDRPVNGKRPANGPTEIPAESE